MNFTKVEGCGNHFILIDITAQRPHEWRVPVSVISHNQSVRDRPPSLSEARVRELCDPSFGVGADGVLLVRCAEGHEIDDPLYEMVVYNADGSLASMCGNGLRCVARYLHRRGVLNATQSKSARILTGAGILDVFISIPGEVGVQMGWPAITEPFLFIDETTHSTLSLATYSLGNPHLVTFSADHVAQKCELAPAWQAQVSDGINISFATLTSPTTIELQVHERGCGWTLACGTGACATVFDAHRQGLVAQDETITVSLPGGDLTFEFTPAGLIMWGPAREIYQGVYEAR